MFAAGLICCSPVAASDGAGESHTVFQKSAPPERLTVDGVWEVVLFYVFAVATLASGAALCVSRNIVRMAVYLFFALGAVAVLYLLLLANFIAVIQLIIYVGGTLILLVFGVMLTSKSPWVRFEVKRSEIFAATVVCVVLAVGLLSAVMTAAWPGPGPGPADEAAAVTNPSMETFGRELLTTYLVPFEAVSVLLLVVLVGAAYIARQEPNE